ncbi:MAG: cation:proton antiporter [Bacteroidales bacterium]
MDLMLLLISDLTLPISNPVLKFLIILVIILFAPLLLNRIKIPHILGLIIAGAVIGPNGLNLVLRDSSIILSGTAGLLYIMFLAGLEIDFNEFIKNSRKSILFGMLTFSIPMVLGIVVGMYVLNLSILTSVLLASMFASHTLIAYPIIAKLGIKRNRAVTITIGGTMLTDTLALLVLAVIVGMTKGEVGTIFWVKLTLSVMAFGAIVMLLFPIIARLFFKRVSDGLSQYIFVLVMVFLGASLAELAGIEAIIGAFLSGLSLNRLIPHSSPLMNRIGFVGNAIFIPFFLIGVGMLIDYRVLISGWDTVYTAFVMTVVATLAKYLAAYSTQKILGYTASERSVIFGLSNAQAAATLAAVMVGYNVILGTEADGSPIRLLDDSILNGTIVMIFITCTIASFAAQRGAQKIAFVESVDIDTRDESELPNILVPVRNPQNAEELIALAYLTSSNNGGNVSVANIVDTNGAISSSKEIAKKIFENSVQYASSADRLINTHLRYDTDYSNGILNLISEHEFTDLVVGVDRDRYPDDAELSRSIDTIVSRSNITIYIYGLHQPIHTIKRHIIVIPPDAEQEFGFRLWFVGVWSMLRATGAEAVVYANRTTSQVIEALNEALPVKLTINAFTRYSDMLIISKDIRKDDGLIFALSKPQNPSYDESMGSIPFYLKNYFKDSNFILVYPVQHRSRSTDLSDLINPASTTVAARIEDIIELVKGVIRVNK